MKPRLKPLAQQVIVITGASSGIGLATARAAAKAGARVVLSSRNAAALLQVEQEIRAAGGEAIHVVADVAKREELAALADFARDAYGSFDTWVNNAGLGIFGRLDEIDEADSRQLFDVNFWGLVNGTLIAAAHLKRFGGGAIINLGSVAADLAFPMQGMYCASKHAIKGFTDSFRMELQSQHAPISLTLIKPTAIDTPFAIHARNYQDRKPTLPPPVYAPEDVAAAILHAAVHGGRDYYIGGGGKIASSLNKRLPSLVDWYGATFVPKQSFKDAPNDRDPAGNLYRPTEDGATHGDSDRLVLRSAYTKASMHPLRAGALLAVAGIAAAAGFFSTRRS